MAITLQMFGGETCHVDLKVTETTDNQRKTIVNSWVRCLENNQLVITSGSPTKMIEYYCSGNTILLLLFVALY